MPARAGKKTRAVRGLVLGYLRSEYPAAAKVMEAQCVLQDFEAGELDHQADVVDRSVVAAVFGNEASLPRLLRKMTGGPGSARPSPKASPHHAPKVVKKPIVSDSDDDDTPAAAPLKKKTPKPTPKATPRAAPAKKPIVHDSDSDDEVPVVRKGKTPKASPKAAPKRAPVVADSDSDDEVVAPAKPKSKTPKASPKVVAKKPVVHDTSDDEAPMPPARKSKTPKASPKAAPARTKPVVDDSDSDADVRVPAAKTSPKVVPSATRQQPPSTAGKKPGERFCRINTEAVQFADDTLKDNRCRDDTANFLQNKRMLAVRGKEFNKHKQKNKAKLYAAGVDQGVHSFKFQNDSD